MGEIDYAYIAGFMDGEGCISLPQRRNTRYLTVHISNTNKSILEYIYKTFNVGYIGVQKRKSKYDINKTLYQWQVHARQALDILKKLEPYLRVKKKEAKLGIRFQEKMIKIGLGQPSHHNKFWQDEMFKELMEIKNEDKKIKINGDV